MARSTLDDRTGDTGGGRPAPNTEPFPELPAEFGRYRVLKLLGRGGMGAVYLARDSQLGREVALKIPFFGAAPSQRLERFAREARAAAALKHPNICTVFDAGEIDGRPFLTMEFVAGTPLEREIDPDAPMDPVRAAGIVRATARALEYAHRKGVVHRDLKPANVMLSPDGEPVVMDFGLAKQLGAADPNESKLTRDGGVLGTPTYMSPEQVRADAAAIGPASDVYALGVILFELLAGAPPYIGSLGAVMGQILTAPVPVLRDLRPDADPQLDAICQRAMAKNPTDRFASMGELADALSAFLSAPGAPGHDVERVEPPVGAAAPVLAPDQLGARDPHPGAAPSGATATPVPRGRRVKPFWIAGAALALLVPLVAWLALVVLRIETPNGTLVVEIDDPAVEARIKGGKLILSGPDGKDRYTLDTAERDTKIAAGDYKVRVEGADGLALDTPEFTLKKGDKVTVRVTAVPPAVAKKELPPEPRPDASGAVTGEKAFVPLFNGKDLTGWVLENGQPQQWRVGPGEVVSSSTGSATRSWVMTEAEYADFTLRFEFQMEPGCMGAVGVRAAPGELHPGKANPPVPLHPLIRITDSTKPPNIPLGTHENLRSAGAQEPNQLADLRTGWNRMEVTVGGDKIRATVNGKMVIDTVLAAPPGGAGLPPALGRRTGRIALQTHTGTIRYRNMEVRDDAPARAEPPSAVDRKPSLIFGEWRVEGKELVQGKAGYARIYFGDKTWTDYDLTFETRTDAGSGAQGGGTVSRSVDTGNHHGFVLGAYDGSLIEASHLEKGRWARNVPPIRQKYETGRWYKVKIRIRGDSIEYFLDDQKLFDYTALFPRGQIGFATFDSVVRWRNIKVTDPKGTVLFDGPPDLPVRAPEPASVEVAASQNHLSMEFVTVPKGKSWLGGSGDRVLGEEVTFAQDFRLGKYPVTQAQWRAVTGKNPSHFSRTGAGKDVVKDATDAALDRLPVEMVSWDECREFVALLNEQTKESGWAYRLPTGAEWEYACRGGPQTDRAETAFDYYFEKPTNQLLPAQANFGKFDAGRTSAVDAYPANRLGLHDMHGNVHQWCADAGRQGAGYRVIRGGSFWSPPGVCRAGAGGSIEVKTRQFNIGLRLVCVPASDGFAPLFNGKDLTGWTSAAGAASKWQVVNGALTCSGPTDYLASERGDYEDFHLRAEVKLNDRGNSGVYFRSRVPAPDKAPGDHYEAQISTRNDQPKTGSLFGLVKVDDVLVPPDTWFTYEIIATGDRVRLLVNGRQTADFTDARPNRPLKGHIALQQWKHTDAETVVAFRKVEIKQLAKKPDAPDRRAAEYVLSVGGTVLVTGGTRDISAIADLPKGAFTLDRVWLRGNRKVTDDGLAACAGIKSLSHLDLVDTPVTDRGLGHFKDCSNLVVLDVVGAPVGDAGLAQLKGCTKIRFLWLGGTRASDEGVAYFAGCRDLLYLDLRDTKVSDAGVAHFTNCRKLTFLDLRRTRVTDAGLAQFKGCADLATVNLVGTKVTDSGLEHLKGHKKLANLYLGSGPTTAKGVAALQAALPACKIEWAPPPADPFQTGSVWVGQNNKGEVTLTVLERKGDTFTAKIVNGAGTEREVTGAVADGKVSWLAKDVKPPGGRGLGADNQGTLTRDKDGELINFTWQQGPNSGEFLVRLKPNK